MSASSIPPELEALGARIAAAGGSLTAVLPDGAKLAVGMSPERTRVRFHTTRALSALLRGDHLTLAEAYLHEEIDIDGDLRQALFVTDELDLGAQSWLRQALVWLHFLVDRRRLNRASVAHHYDRPPDFFLAWLDPSRSYTHGFYDGPDDDLAVAQRRKLQFAIDALGLAPGMDVLDVGCGWGSFLEYAGAQGIHVHGLTLSPDQHAFVSARIRERALPCTVACVDFHDYRPARPFDGAVFMGSLEHLPDYRYVARFLARHLRPGARAYADFVSSREGWLAGAFLRKYIFPGISGYVEPDRLRACLATAGLESGPLGDDTKSCAYTVRDWARALERTHADVAARHGEVAVRAFLLYLWSSHHFLMTRRTEAYHLVVRRPGGPGLLPRA
jgi:cyclopropane-fatty-acyl-phospholipid synthase